MNIQERIEALETEFNEKIKALKAEAQQGDEFPQDGDVYWLINTAGETNWARWHGAEIENKRLSFGNVFQTEEEADFAVEKLKVEAELRKFSRPFKNGQPNCNVILSDNENVSTAYWNEIQTQGSIYFESEEKAKQVIQSVGEERIKKYIFGVED